MPLADTSRSVLRYSEESVIGTTDPAPLKELRFTSESLSQSKTTSTSSEIRSDRQITDLVSVDSEPSGDVGFELSYDNLDDFLPGALLSSGWVGVGGGTTETITSGASASNLEFSLNATGNTITFGSGVTHAIVTGQWFSLTGSTADDGYHKAVAVSGQEITVDSITTTEVLDETDLATVKGSMIRNGVTEHGYTLEKEFADVTQFLSYVGMEVGTLSLDITSNALVTGSMSFIGRSAAVAQVTVGTGSPVNATTNDVFNATSNLASIRENGTALSVNGDYAMALTLSIDNGLRSQKAIGVDGNIGVGKGRCTITGTVDIYFRNEVMYEKYLNSTETNIDFRIQDNAGNAYIVTLGKVKFTEANPEISGIDSDVVVSFSYQALRDPTNDFTIQIDKIPG